jgi:hypothetical protein
VIAVNQSADGAVYKGLALGFTESGAFLFATNFRAGTVDVFDSKFQRVHTHDKFKDPHLPPGYAPFGIAAINARLYVTYALQDADKKDDAAGAGHGFIDIFDTEGRLVTRFASEGQLDSLWGMAWAPFQGFGRFNNALFVGNFGNGRVNAFDFDSGEFLGAVSDAGGTAIHIPGVWALQFGLGVARASSSTLFFTAGIDDERHGLFGTLMVTPSVSAEQSRRQRLQVRRTPERKPRHRQELRHRHEHRQQSRRPPVCDLAEQRSGLRDPVTFRRFGRYNEHRAESDRLEDRGRSRDDQLGRSTSFPD